MTSHALTNGVDKQPSDMSVYANGIPESDGDPEIEAEQEYAREHGLTNDTSAGAAAAAAAKQSSPLKDPSHMKEKLAHRLKAFRGKLFRIYIVIIRLFFRDCGTTGDERRCDCWSRYQKSAQISCWTWTCRNKERRRWWQIHVGHCESVIRGC